MAKKKSKEPNKNSNNAANSNSIFKTLFGDTPEDATAASLFSDSNPFRRKPNDSSQTLPNKEEKQLGLGLGFEEAPIENPQKTNGVVFENDNDSAELKKKKRKKDKKANFDAELIAEESKKLKRGVELEESVNPVEFSKKGKGKKRNLELNSERMSEKEGNEKPNSEKMSKKEGKESPNLGLESKGLAKKGNGVSDDLGVKNEGREEKKKKRKRKRDEIEVQYEKKRYGEVVKDEDEDEDENKEDEGVVVGEKRKKMDNPEDLMVSKEGFDDEDKLSRTVFVGNLALKVKKKVLIKEFEKFGEVESVRIRSVPIADSKVPRKGAIIKKKLNENADSVHAYIVYKTEDSAQASLAHNMAVVGGNHIRVDRACPPRKKLKGDTAALYDNKRTVFVGNLPFDVKDEELYQLFTGMKDLESSIEAVRVIRDPNTSLGKGIAYVLFKTRDAVNRVVKKQNLKLRNRELRLDRTKPNSTPSKSKNLSPSGKNYSSSKKFGEDSRTPGSYNKMNVKATMSYQGLQASKSGIPKKGHGKTGQPVNLNSRTQKVLKPKDNKRKRPAVAARKAKALKADAALKQGGTKRKLGNRTPDSARQKKKARKNW